MGIIRETYHRCLKVRQILKTHLVKFEEKDVFMSREVQKEIRERMKMDEIVVPQVFVEGLHIGVSTAKSKNGRCTLYRMRKRPVLTVNQRTCFALPVQCTGRISHIRLKKYVS
jgi:glutaredoxin